jgi:uncharacterized membrane protein
LLSGEAAPSKALFFASGAVWVHPGRMLEALTANMTGERWDAARLRAALSSFRGARKVARVGGELVRAWELDALRLVEALGLDGAALDRVAGA